ncbi:hypothetical protein [Chondromyces crocatus]|uniref:Uncharacterized protein n=1 Tax=Chondromyces crocatus TaxID=52 RepID=A0A0K1EDT3_CHOCO|nr:hypothetical protein [Chondromyces crocatus]AKT39035.1 uncharacterized protein CMC5_031810 [Chondromyces crocatus]
MIDVGLDESDPLGVIDQAFHDAYAAHRAEALSRMSPIVAQIDDSLILRHRGERFEGLARTRRYHELKAMSHLPLAVYLTLWGLPSPFDEAARARLTVLGERLALAEASLPRRRFTVDELPRQRRLFASAHALLQRALTEGHVTRETLIAYVRAQSPDIIHNAEGSARDQIETMHATLEGWRKTMPPEEWNRLQAVVTVSHMARPGNAAFQYFSVTLGGHWEGRFDQEELHPDARVVASEGTLDERAAFDLLATRALDGRMAQHFFREHGRLHRDVLSDATERILAEMFQKTPAPPRARVESQTPASEGDPTSGGDAPATPPPRTA